MKSPKEILDPGDYANYRHVRSISVMYMVGAVLILFAGIVAIFVPLGKDAAMGAYAVKFTFVALLMLWALGGFVGPIAILRGNRKWSPLVLLVAGMYLTMFPIGTLLSVIFFRGFKRYFDSIEQINAANSPELA